MTLASMIMFAVAGVILVAGLIVVTRRVTTEQGIYARRIAGTMLLTLGGVLGFFAWSMAGWGLSV